MRGELSYVQLSTRFRRERRHTAVNLVLHRIEGHIGSASMEACTPTCSKRTDNYSSAILFWLKENERRERKRIVEGGCACCMIA